MTVRNHRLRFAANNHAFSPNTPPTVSSELADFPFSNAQNPVRSKVWKPSGSFTITDLNNKLYIDEGSGDVTVTLTNAVYSTGTALASHLETAINAALSVRSVTVSYDAVTTFLFTFTFDGNVNLSTFSNTTNSAWDTIGFVTTGADILSQAVISTDESRIHSSEYAIFDFGYPAEISFFAMIPPADTTLGLTENATVTVKANNINDFSTTAPFEKTATVTPNGIFEFLDPTDQIDDLPSFRFWQMEIKDRSNPLGTDFLSIGHIYLGDFETITSRNVQAGFGKQLEDPSLSVQSDSGALFFDERIKYRRFQSLDLLYLDPSERRNLEDFINIQGISNPFYLALDPTQVVTASSDELILYGVFERVPSLSHVKKDTYSLSIDFREVV